jgi:hypothetical protein
MATIKHECPHCRILDIALAVSSWTAVVANNVRDECQAVAHLSCPRCYMPSAAHLKCESGPMMNFGHLANFGGDPTTTGWEIAGFWPEGQPRLSTFADAIRLLSRPIYPWS